MKQLQTPPERDIFYFDHIWQTEFAKRPWKYDAVRHRELSRYVKPGDSVVDLGAGVYGTVQFILEVLRVEIQPHAYDISPLARELVRKEWPQIDYRVGRLPDTPYADHSFDLVIATQIVETLQDPYALATEMARICKWGGEIACATIDMNAPVPQRHGPWPDQWWALEAQDLIDLFTPYGFTTYVKLGDYHIVHCHRG